MSSLKEKAKRAWQIGQLANEEEKWVRLEEAQKEIDDLKFAIQHLNENLEEISNDKATMAKNYNKFVNERLELKQKLDKLIDELKHRPSEKGAPYSTYQEGWLDGMALAIQKFEELLK